MWTIACLNRLKPVNQCYKQPKKEQAKQTTVLNANTLHENKNKQNGYLIIYALIIYIYACFVMLISKQIIRNQHSNIPTIQQSDKHIQPTSLCFSKQNNLPKACKKRSRT